MREACGVMIAFGKNLAPFDQNGAYGGIRGGAAKSLRRLGEGDPHEVLIL